jgi:hypothetical protein
VAEVTAFRHNVLPYPLYGLPYAITFPMLDADGDLVTGATTPDAEKSLNGDTFADCTNESVEIATNSGVYYLLLTGAEMTADIVTVIAKSATAGMKTTVITLYPRKLVSLHSGTVGANAGDGTTIQLASGASTIDDYYNGCIVVGTLDSTTEVRLIGDYVGSTLVCTVSGPAFIVSPDNNDTYVVYNIPESRMTDQSVTVGWIATTLGAAQAAGYPSVTIKDGTGTGEIDTTSGGVLVAAIAANAITATAINADAITAAKIADGAIDAATFAANAITSTVVANDFITAAKLHADVTTELQSGLATAAALDAVDNFVDTEIQTIITMLTGIVPVNGTIGATGNDSTHLHLSGLAWADDGPNSMLVLVKDVSAGVFESKWISDFANAGDLATLGSALSFTPEASVDLYWILSPRADVTGGAGLDAAGVRAAVGLASANLDTQLGAIDDLVDTEVAAIKTVVDAVQAKTDNLPSDPADASVVAGLITAVDDLVDTEVAAIKTVVDAIQVKTDGLPSDPADASVVAGLIAGLDAKLDTIDNFLDTEIAAILEDTGTTLDDFLDTEVAAILSDTNAIKAVTDLLTAAQSEPTGVPAANATPLVKLGIIYMMLRNKVTVSATKKTFFDDGDAPEFEKDLSDDGTDYQESEVNAI